MEFFKNLSVQVGSSNFLKRFILSLIMILIFTCAIKYKTLLILLVICIKFISSSEIFKLNEKFIRKGDRFLYTLPYYYILCFDLNNLEAFRGFIRVPYFNFILKNSVFLSFIFYIFGLIFFILKLGKRNLRQFFYYLGIIHIVIFSMGIPAFEAIKLILLGRFWFVLSAYLVIVNDIFAFVWGKLFGRHMLIRLSPNKTIEGFVGAFFSTAVAGFLFVYLRHHYNILYDLNDHVTFTKRTSLYVMTIPTIYLHTLMLVLFASFVAPFGGFLASAYKRLLKIKDFASYIPGHGGMIDRMDCQYIMAVFVRLYINTFIIEREKNYEKIAKSLYDKYSADELINILIFLRKFIKK